MSWTISGPGAGGLGDGMPVAPAGAPHVADGKDWAETIQRTTSPAASIAFDGSEDGTNFVYNGSANSTVSLEALASIPSDYQVLIGNESTKPSKTLTLSPDGSETINGEASLVIEVGESWVLTKASGADYQARNAAIDIATTEVTSSIEAGDDFLLGRGVGNPRRISQINLKSELGETIAVATDSTLTGNGRTATPLGLSASVEGGIRVIGFWDAGTNTPDLSALTEAQGEAYQVSVAGSTSLNGETNWGLKDLVVWDDNLSGNWFKIDNTDDVISVNSQTGVVVLDTDDVDEGSNLYYTEGRVSANTSVAANTTHSGLTTNPHSVTKAQVGLGSADNTSDADKPVSTAQQTEIDTKKDDFTENTAFNKGFGTSAGTVLEGDTVILSPAYGGISRSSAGTQQLTATLRVLEFNQNDLAAGTTPDQANDLITIDVAGTYRVQFHGSVVCKRDSRYTISIRVNGGTPDEMVCLEVPDDNYCWGLSGSITLVLAVDDELELVGISAGSNKDFKLQVGSAVTVIRVS